MIYINTVQTNRPMKEIKTARDFTFFKDYKPQRFEYPTNEDEEKAIKLFKMNIVIAGQMTGNLKRNNENVFSRSLLLLDFDDIHESEATFLSKVNEILKGCNYCLYPTLKYKEDNIRYRLVLELDRSVNASEYEKLLFGISLELGVNFTFDSSNKTWSQGQGAPVITQYSEHVSRIYHDQGEAIPADLFLQKITNSKEYKRELEKQPRHNFNLQTGYQRTANGKGKVIQILEELTQGVQEGARNSSITRAYGTLLKANMQPSLAMGFLWTMNQQFIEPPLDDKEFLKIIESITNKNNQKGRR